MIFYAMNQIWKMYNSVKSVVLFKVVRSSKEKYNTFSFCFWVKLQKISNWMELKMSIVPCVLCGIFGIMVMLLIATYKNGFIAVGNESSLAIAWTLLCTNPILSIPVDFGTNVWETAAHNFSRSSLTRYVMDGIFIFCRWRCRLFYGGFGRWSIKRITVIQ